MDPQGRLAGAMQQPDVYVTNYNPNFTGVSATINAVVPAQQKTDLACALVGVGLPNVGAPITRMAARVLCKTPPQGRDFSIWHVRRNPEMRAAIWARDVLRRPIKIVFTSAAQRRHSAYPRWLISKMDAVIATTDAAAEFVPHVRAVVPHGVDTSVFMPPENRAGAWAELGYGGQLGIAAIGRVRPEKGTDVFVRTMIKTLPKYPTAVALVIGRAGDKHRAFKDGLQAEVAAAGLSGRIKFLGEVSADKMPAILRAISLLVPLPRYEGYGLTPLEGMASGVPFVASDTGYFRRFLGDGNYGTIVRTEDIDTASAAVDRWLNNPEALAIAGIAAAKAAREHFSVETEAAGIRGVYDALWAGAI